MNIEWMDQACAVVSESATEAASQRQTQLTKPAGALGELESLAIRLAGLQATDFPSLDNVHICVFAADHGVAEEGVSAFPQAVTAAMVNNFAHGGAAISVAAKQIKASFDIVNLGTVSSTDELEAVRNINIAKSTQNFVQQAAMSAEQLAQALDVGRQLAQECADKRVDLFIGGEMGIANSTSASAMACALLNVAPVLLAGPGTGLDEQGVKHKAKVIEAALQKHAASLSSGLDILRILGGFEIAALCGAYIRCAQLGIPALVDGFISSVAALCATRINPAVATWLLFSHQSAEPGHAAVLECLQGKPLLKLSMRLGEASGAAVAVPIMRMACALHNQMATFEQAQVAGKL